MSKVRIYEVAKELGMEQKALVAVFQSMGFGEVRNHMSSVDPEVVERVRRHIDKQKSSSTVEERIRPTVIKRRAVARPDGPEVPNDVASRPAAIAPRASVKAVAAPAPIAEPAPPVAEAQPVHEVASYVPHVEPSPPPSPPAPAAPPPPPPARESVR